MAESIEPVRVTILDKEYVVACPPEEKEGLLSSAHTLDRRMREIRDGGKVVGADRIAVMAALNLTHELLQTRSEQADTARTVQDRIRSMEARIAQVLPE